jgi:hypothetical protein
VLAAYAVFRMGDLDALARSRSGEPLWGIYECDGVINIKDTQQEAPAGWWE